MFRAALAAAFALAGCSATFGPSAASSPTVAVTSRPTAAPSPSARPASTPAKIARVAKLTGTGSKQGPAVTLQGDYVLKDAVNAKPGCHFTVYLVGWGAELLDDYQTDADGSYSTSIDEQGLDLGQYRLKVTSSGCGSWSVVLSRR